MGGARSRAPARRGCWFGSGRGPSRRGPQVQLRAYQLRRRGMLPRRGCAALAAKWGSPWPRRAIAGRMPRTRCCGEPRRLGPNELQRRAPRPTAWTRRMRLGSRTCGEVPVGHGPAPATGSVLAERGPPSLPPAAACHHPRSRPGPTCKRPCRSPRVGPCAKLSGHMREQLRVSMVLFTRFAPF